MVAKSPCRAGLVPYATLSTPPRDRTPPHGFGGHGPDHRAAWVPAYPRYQVARGEGELSPCRQA